MAAPSTHSATDSHHLPERAEFWQMFIRLLGPEHRFYKLVVIYSLAISLLTLAIPISVQALIDTIANIGIVRAIVVISLILFGLLMVSGVLYALEDLTASRQLAEAESRRFEAGFSDFFQLNQREQVVAEAELKRWRAHFQHQVALANFYRVSLDLKALGLNPQQLDLPDISESGIR